VPLVVRQRVNALMGTLRAGLGVAGAFMQGRQVGPDCGVHTKTTCGGKYDLQPKIRRENHGSDFGGLRQRHSGQRGHTTDYLRHQVNSSRRDAK